MAFERNRKGSANLKSIDLSSEFNREEPIDPRLPPIGGNDVLYRLLEFKERQRAIRRKLTGSED